MNEEWLAWTRHNLQRGCAPAEIKAILQKNGFSDEEILVAMSLPKPGLWNKFKHHVGQAVQQAEAQAAESSGDVPKGIQPDLDYAVMAQPRITHNADARRIEAEGIQLYVMEEFMSRAECEAIMAQINQNLRPSTITTGKDYSGFRTSSTCDLGNHQARIVEKIDRKIASTLGVRLSWSETIQGQKYEVGQEFKAHTDYFEPGTKEFHQYAADLGQRTWTFMVYLNDTPKGGATHFPKLDKTFYPKTGRAVIWNNLLDDGSPNPLTLHHGMPVEEGSKLIITKWFRDKGKGDPLFPVR